MTTDVERLAVLVEARVRDFERQMQKADRTIAKLEQTAAKTSRGIERSTSRAAAKMERDFTSASANIATKFRALPGIITGAFAAIGGGAGAMQVARVAMAFEGVERTLLTVSGSAQAAAADMDFLRGVSDRLGTDLLSSADAFASLAAAAKGTSAEGQAARDIFEAVSQSMAVLGRSSADTEGALRAVEQMISKGKVSAEELRGQLGERLPGAFRLAAQAIGVTTAELDEMLQAGEVVADASFLSGLARELRNALPADRVQGLRAELGRLTNTWNDFLKAVADAGATDAMATSLSEIDAAVRSLMAAGVPEILATGFDGVAAAAGHVRQLAEALGAVTVAIRDVPSVLPDWMQGSFWDLGNRAGLAVGQTIADQFGLGEEFRRSVEEASRQAGEFFGEATEGAEEVSAEVAGLTREWQALLREAEGLEAAIDAAGNADGLPAIRDRLDEIAVSVLRLADRFRELGAAIPSDADLMAGNGPGGFYGAPGHIGPEGAGFTYGAGVGPRTAAATPRTRPDYSGGGPMLLQVARGFLGAREDRDADILSNLFRQAGHNIDPKMVAWCAAFVNAVLATQGLPGTGSLGARSFLDYGRETNDPKPGDLAVFSRGSDPNAGHVGFFVGFDENGDVRIVGGNQGGARMGGGGVTETTMPRDRLLGFRQVAGGGRGSPVDESLTQLGERNQLATEAHNEALARQSALEAEAAAMREQNATSLERYVQGLERASALLQQGAIDHETYNREVARLGDAYAQATEAADQLNTVTPDLESGLAGMQSLFGTVTGSLEQIAEGGESARKALIRLALQLAQMALFGGGPFGGGILGQLMGGISGGGGINIPGRATGGPVTAGMPYVVGERRPELFVPNVSGRILPRIPTLSGGAGGAASGMRVVVNDMRTQSSPPVAQQRRTGPDGRDELVLTIMEEIRTDVEKGGPVSEVLERRYFATRRF